MTNGRERPRQRLRERRSGVALCGMAFVVLFAYALARPATESLFLAEHGSAGLPGAWIAVAVAVALAVALYNRAASKLELMHVLWASQAASAVILAGALWLSSSHASSGSFVLYVWKDVHIVVLLEALWSFANLVFSARSARWAYGFFCAAGSLGGIAGNLLVGVLAEWLGSAQALWLVMPAFAIEALLAAWLGRASGRPRPPSSATPSLSAGVLLLAKSSTLRWLLLLVGIVQLVVNLVDFQYNAVLEQSFPDTDTRTAISGRVYAAIDAASLVLQLSSGAVFGAAGLRATLVAVPALVGSMLGWYLIAPGFVAIAAAKLASKALDYSLQRAGKEMLYLPLGYDEKTRGKALVDMLTYRVSKAGASLLVRGLLAVGAQAGALWMSLALVGVWIGVSWRVTKAPPLKE